MKKTGFGNQRVMKVYRLCGAMRRDKLIADFGLVEGWSAAKSKTSTFASYGADMLAGQDETRQSGNTLNLRRSAGRRQLF